MATSVLAAVIDRLVQIDRAALDVPVYDGMPTRSITDKQCVVIGVDDLTSPTGEAATAGQEWASLGRMSRDERGQISAVAVAWSGTGDFSPVRLTAFDLVAQHEKAVRADPSMALGFQLTWAEVSVTRVLQLQSDQGPGVHVQFQTSYRARI